MCLRIGSSPISSPTSLFYGFLALQTVGPSQRWDYQYGDQGQCAVIPHIVGLFIHWSTPVHVSSNI